MADTPEQSQSDQNAEDGSAHSSHDKLIETAKARFKLCVDATQEDRALALDDLKFRAGSQWHESDVQARKEDGRPCLVINRIPQFIQQIANDQRQNRPAIKVHPVDDNADDETAKIIQGLIRHIEYNSNADAAYDTAFESAATIGFGYFRVLTEYCDPMSFDQEILIKRIRNPFTVHLDPYSQEPDGSDAQYGFIVDDMSPDDYRAQFPKSKLAQTGEWETAGATSPDWVTSEHARVAEYFYKDFKEVEIVLLSNGATVEKAKLREYAEEMLQQGMPADQVGALTVTKERTTRVPVVKWCKLNAVEILEETECPGSGKYIPIIPCYGTEIVIDGKVTHEGITRNAKDSQRMLNYWKSAQTEAIALAPRAPFIGAEGQFEGHPEWETANKRNHAFLEYKPVSLDGKPMPPPQRQAFEPAVQAITQAAMMAADDMKAVIGMFDASLGAQSNETSGIAIQRRNNQSQTANFHFVDNLTRSIKHTGRILIDWMPHVYDGARTSRIIGDDNEQDIKKLNQPTGEIGKDGKPLIYALDVGKYDATVDVGPSFATKRQEAVMSLIDLSKSIPQIGQAAPDIIARNMDWQGAQELSERLKKTLPPGLVDDPKKQGQQIPPQVQQQMQQAQQMVEQLTQKLNELQDEKDQKLVEIESKERIEMAKLHVQLEIERAKLDAKDSLRIFDAELAQIEQRLNTLRQDQPISYGEAEQPHGSPEQEQNFAQEGAGGMSAMGAGPEESLTGEASPGSPMEGQPTP